MKTTFRVEAGGSASSIAMNEQVYELKRSGLDPIVLSYGEAPFEFVNLGLESIDLTRGAHYCESRGLPELISELLKSYESDNITSLSEGSFLITAGSKIALYMIACTFIEAESDFMLLHEPCWVSYAEHARLCGGSVKYISHNLDIVSGLLSHIDAGNVPKLLILNNPNNPSGYLYRESELREVAEICQRSGTVIVCDESYSDYVSEGEFFSMASLVGQYDNVIVVNSLSKNFGLSGWRIGFIIAPPPIINYLLQLNRHLMTCAPTILQLYCAKYFEKIKQNVQSEIRKLQAKRRLVIALLKKYEFDYLEGGETFYFFLDLRRYITSSSEFCRKFLMEELVALVPGEAYGAKTNGYVRLSFAAESIERVDVGLAKLRKFCDSLTVGNPTIR